MSIIIQRPKLNRTPKTLKFSNNLTSETTITWFQAELCPECHKPHLYHQHCLICHACHLYNQPHCQNCNGHHSQNSEMAYCQKCDQCMMYFDGKCRCGNLLVKPTKPEISQTYEPDPALDTDEEEIQRMTLINTQLHRSPKKLIIPPQIKDILYEFGIGGIDLLETSSVFY